MQKVRLRVEGWLRFPESREEVIMHRMEKDLALFENLVNRVEAVRDSYNYRLPGNLTNSDYAAMKTAALILTCRVKELKEGRTEK